MSFSLLTRCCQLKLLARPLLAQSSGVAVRAHTSNTPYTTTCRHIKYLRQTKQLHSTTLTHKPVAVTLNSAITVQRPATSIDRYAALSLSTYDLVWQYIQQKRSQSTALSSYIWLLIRFTVLLNICRMLLLDLTTVTGKSMEPTFDSKSNIVIFENVNVRLRDVFTKLLVYLNALELDINTVPLHSPIPFKRGDIIIAQHPDVTHRRRLIVKRIVGLPGDVLTYTVPNSTASKTVTVPQNKLFILGDNPAASCDSRMYGALDYSKVIGRVIARVYPLHKINWCDTSAHCPHVDVQHTNTNTTADVVDTSIQ